MWCEGSFVENGRTYTFRVKPSKDWGFRYVVKESGGPEYIGTEPGFLGALQMAVAALRDMIGVDHA
jgi:hypothetical protein